MAESRAVSVVPLNARNYATWKIQCRMALIRDGLWEITSGKETEPPGSAEAEVRRKYSSRKDRALATIVLAVEPDLLYLIGTDPTDPQKVWTALANQFERKTWANKLALKRKLFSMRLSEGGSVQAHIKSMTELWGGLAAIGEPLKEEDQVVYLLASLPESYSVLVTALEASADVPSLAVVTERLLHEEAKMKTRPSQSSQEGALTSKLKKTLRCHYCNKPGHFKKDCEELAKVKGQSRTATYGKKKSKIGAFKVTITAEDESGNESEGTSGLVVQHGLSAVSKPCNDWIVDSGATSHMCSDKSIFTNLHTLSSPLPVTLGDGRSLQAVGRGDIVLKMNLPQERTESCILHDVLLIPELSYNLLSVTSAAKRGKMTTFNETTCEIKDSKSRVIALGHREGGLYYLDHGGPVLSVHVSQHQDSSRKLTWHRRFGHLGKQSIKELARSKMVNGLDVNVNEESEFCEPCAMGKIHRLPFQPSTRRAEHRLEVVHNDVCGKIGTKSLSGAEYFVTFIDDHTRFAWIYVIKHKDEVFQRFQEWKAQVEKMTGKKVKALRSDNGGEYTSNEFTSFLTEEGIKHEQTMPHTPEQNGVAERLNRTLMESVRTMLADSKLPHRFWAEALSTSVYLRNRSPTKALEGITPYEAWNNIKPDVSFLRAFGCTAYAHVPKVERHKLDYKSRKCVMLGYSDNRKGYRLYDIERKKVIHSRDVVFNEAVMPGTQFEEDAPIKYVELEIQDEPTITVETDTPDNSTEQQIPTDPEATVRRSTRPKNRTLRYGYDTTMVSTEQLLDPSSVAEAKSLQDRDQWEKAMDREMNSLRSNDVWDLVEPPPNGRIVGSKWLFKRKVNEDGTMERYKARLVAQGHTQKFGLDYEETFSPVVRFESIRSVVALAAEHRLKLHQMDVSTAFLHGELAENVYMRQPEGFIDSGKENLVCRLKRSIYGLKQSPRCWNTALDSHLKEMGFKQSKSDPCLYMKCDSEGARFLVAVYVDDIVLGGENEAELKSVKKRLSQRFEMKDLGPLHCFLGVKIVQDEASGSIWMGQPSYTEKILQKYGMAECKAVSTPASPDVKLVPCANPDDVCDQQAYQAIVGSLLYLSTKTRPDIAYAVSCIARFSAKPTREHWTAVKRVLRYLQGTSKFGLLYGNVSVNVVGYSDADWAGDIGDRKSTSGYVFLLGGAAISWKSSKQTCVALSTAEAEYIALSAASQEAVWLQQLFSDLLNERIQETVIFEDNQLAICLAKNQQVHGRSKHIDIKFHYIRELVEDGKINLVYCASEDMIADILTKPLRAARFEKLRLLTGVVAYKE